MSQVYVIEDDPAVADAFVMFLEMQGRKATAFSDAESFLCGVEPDDGDTLVIDLGLPGMSGKELIELVLSRQVRPTIVIVSGQRQVQLDKELTGLPFEAVLRKPLEIGAVEKAFACGSGTET